VPNSESQSSNKELRNFEKYFFKALLHLGIDVKEICRILLATEGAQQNTNYEKSEFVIKLANVAFDYALQLYKFGKLNGLNDRPHLCALLLAGLYNNGYEDALPESMNLFNTKQDIAIIFWGAIKNRPSELIDHIINLYDHINKEDIETVRHYVFTLQKLLQHAIDGEYVERIFHIYFQLLGLMDEAITNCVWNTLSWSIEGYEEQRYDLLKAALNNKFIKGYFIKDYFHNFKDPSFFFEFFAISYTANKSRTNIEIFTNGFEHFTSSDYNKTEKEILSLLAHENIHLRIGISKLWIGSRINRKPLNILLLASEVEQLRALEGLVMFPYGINDILPSLLIARKSQYPNVIIYLQQTLCTLVSEAYHEYIYELIEKELENTSADKKFLKPIKQCLSTYTKIRDNKKAHNDLNPLTNEKSLVQLYYNLEREKNAQSVEDINNDEHSFLSQIKSVIIVRGNSWKIEEKDISALGHVEASIPIDMRIYKNPDQFEIQLNFPKAKF
jgi:hypothetical protein